MPAEPSPLPPLALNGRDAARMCGLCEKSLYLAVKAGELRAVRIGRAVRYLASDLQARLESKRTPFHKEAAGSSPAAERNIAC